MDIDPNFHESEGLFYDSLGHIKREEEESDEEETKEQTSEQEALVEKSKAGKPVKFLERPKEAIWISNEILFN